MGELGDEDGRKVFLGIQEVMSRLGGSDVAQWLRAPLARGRHGFESRRHTVGDRKRGWRGLALLTAEDLLGIRISLPSHASDPVLMAARSLTLARGMGGIGKGVRLPTEHVGE